jgi:hypothetical protein
MKTEVVYSYYVRQFPLISRDKANSADSLEPSVPPAEEEREESQKKQQVFTLTPQIWRVSDLNPVHVIVNLYTTSTGSNRAIPDQEIHVHTS